jgi:hypothetical protein
MAEESERFEPAGQPRKEVVGDRVIRGVPFRGESGTKAWHITTELTTGENDGEYLFKDSVFFRIARIDYAVNLGAENHMQIGSPATDIESVKEENMREAVAKWDKEALEQACT